MNDIGTTETVYYAFKEKPFVSGQDFEISGFGYRGFRCTRDAAYLLYSIAYEDGTSPPEPLAGKFTDKTTVRDTIDAFLLAERNRQASSEA
jgi:hypothetical protein